MAAPAATFFEAPAGIYEIPAFAGMAGSGRDAA
jgi:hypothetical protein